MYISFAVNKYLHTVASVGFLLTLNYDARNHEPKICCSCLGGIVVILCVFVVLCVLLFLL